MRGKWAAKRRMLFLYATMEMGRLKRSRRDVVAKKRLWGADWRERCSILSLSMSFGKRWGDNFLWVIEFSMPRIISFASWVALRVEIRMWHKIASLLYLLSFRTISTLRTSRISWICLSFNLILASSSRRTWRIWFWLAISSSSEWEDEWPKR